MGERDATRKFNYGKNKKKEKKMIAALPQGAR
jgi:hypothetical protein